MEDFQDFEEIYRKYYNRVYSFLYKMCQNADLCEELTQESFYQALCSFHRYDGTCTIFTWLAAVAKNTFLKHLRKNKNASVDIELFAEVLSGSETEQPESIFQREAQQKRVRESIEALPKKYRDVIILRIYGDLPFAEIGASLGITENSAKVIFFRAKNTLKEILTDEIM
ncbi:MAG: sigma-70 family RNA polymerase sigma factor [Oscillospiraceae bacterium]|nr:sigma-70 family RNA polymerase sigma factor [Oscillospiraceae bacterium]